MPEPKTPPGYKLVTKDDSIPSFIRENVGNVMETKSARLKTDAPGVETVADSVPGKITVYDPARYNPQIRNHEMTHQFQSTRDDGSIKLPFGYKIQTSAPKPYMQGDGTVRSYDYGGEEGLRKLRNDGKTAEHLNQEQQADLVADYKEKQNQYLAKVKSGKATPQDLRAMYETFQAYHPFVQQMADLPKSNSYIDAMKHLFGLGALPSPAAPGLPSYDTPGLEVAPADPLMGGKSQPISSPVVGTKKTFKNGKMGTWDGTGWRQVQ